MTAEERVLRARVVQIFNDSAAMEGNEPAFIKALDAFADEVRQTCSGYPLVEPYEDVVARVLTEAGEDWRDRQKRRTLKDSRGKA